MRILRVVGVLIALGGPAWAANGVKGVVVLPKALLEPRDKTHGYWRLENGVVPIGPPLRSAYESSLVVFESGAKSKALGKETVTVDLLGLDFVPKLIAIQQGATVEFKNRDRHTHFLYSPENQSFFKQEPTPVGASRQIRFFAPGAVLVRCEAFPHMNGAIIVLAEPYSARPDRDGSFSVPDLPPGPYTARVFTHDRWVHQESVQVTGGAETLELRVPPPKEREPTVAPPKAHAPRAGGAP